jgi:hypothetical protein
MKLKRHGRYYFAFAKRKEYKPARRQRPVLHFYLNSSTAQAQCPAAK